MFMNHLSAKQSEVEPLNHFNFFLRKKIKKKMGLWHFLGIKTVSMTISMTMVLKLYLCHQI